MFNRKLQIAFTLAGVFIVLLFSWLPHPDIGNLPIFPKGIGKWINYYGNLRTAVPFFLVTLVLELSLENISKFRKWILPASLFLVILAEAGQLLLPKRHFDIWDIFWGMVGAVAGIACAFLVKTIINKLKSA